MLLIPSSPGHPKVRLFVTHGGQNSLLQAVYHGVPVLAIPLFGDQFDNVVRAEAKGLGLSLRPTDITSQRIVDAVQTLTQEDRYGHHSMGGRSGRPSDARKRGPEAQKEGGVTVGL